MPKKAKTTNTRRLAGSIVEPGRIELPTSCLPQTQRSTNEEPQPPTATAMATKAKNPGPQAWVSLIPLWSLGESNSRHLACKASALPTVSYTHLTLPTILLV